MLVSFSLWLSSLLYERNSPPKSELSPEILLCTYLISGIELIVFTFLGDELVVGTALDDPALFQDHDAVGIADRGKTMGNNEGVLPS